MTQKETPMKPYYELLQSILDSGSPRGDRTGTGTLSLFGEQIKFNLKDGFPLLPGKFTPFRLIKSELLWFLSGSTDNECLRKLNGESKPTIWEEWATWTGQLGPIYGYQWRSWGKSEGWGGIDQIKTLIRDLKTKPFSRRHIVSAWNVADLPDEGFAPTINALNGRMSLAPCHTMFQLYVEELKGWERASLLNPQVLADWRDAVNRAYEADIGDVDNVYTKLMDEADIPKFRLSCKLYQRSCDTFLGLPFNIASYALLTHMIAQVVNMDVGNLIITFGDTHIYKNHINQARELLSRDLSTFPLCSLDLNGGVKNIDSFTMDDINVVGYRSHPAIKAPISI